MSSAARAAVFGLACFALVANALLGLSLRVPPWLLPATLLPALGCAVRSARSLQPPRGAAEWVAAVSLAVTFVALCYGCLATPSREWDGAVAWEPKARALASDPTTSSAFFSVPAVYVHSRDYPLLQPLCQASLVHWLGERGGRLLFPLLWLVLLGLCSRAATRQRWSLARCAMLLGAALMPALVSPGPGAVDSGYAELFLATALAAVATAFLTGDRPLLLAAAVVLLLVKPEGPYYLAALALALVGPWTCLILLALLPFAVFFGFHYLSVLVSVLPPTVAAEAWHALLPNKFGFVHVLLTALALAPRRLVGPCPSPALGRFVLYGLILVAGSFLPVTDQSLEDHVRSSMTRLLLQWSLPAWLLVAAWLLRVQPSMAPATAEGPARPPPP